MRRSGPSTHRFYYRSADIAVTDRWFVNSRRAYNVTQLGNLRMARGAYDPMVVGTAVIAVVILVAGTASLLQIRPAAWPVVIGIALIPVSVAVATWRLRSRPFELWAEYQGEAVQLFTSTDEKIFGHVCRALIRARESGNGEGAAEPQVLPAA
jgi:hypothetical protein